MHASDADKRQAFEVLADGLEALCRQLPEGVTHTFRRSASFVELEIARPSKRHRRLVVSGGPDGVEYELGKIWTENLACETRSVAHLLAACDALVAGRVREVKDRRTGLLYHIYRLKTRGLNTYARDSEYCLAHHLRLKVRRVRIHSIPPLAPA